MPTTTANLILSISIVLYGFYMAYLSKLCSACKLYSNINKT